MELHPLSEPLADPFFAALRRRHPDVDVVLLPPEPPAPSGPAEPVDADVAAATLARVDALARQLWAAAARESEAAPQARFGYGSGPGAVRAVARVTTRRDDGFHVLVALRAGLEAEGWQVTRPPGAVERLQARLDDLTVAASYADEAGALLFEVTSESLAVGEARARELARTPGGER